MLTANITAVDQTAVDQQRTAFDDAIQLLLNTAYGDTGGSRRCAAFLLSLWNGDTFRADLQELLYTDHQIHNAMVVVLQHLFRFNNQLYTYVTDKQMAPIIDTWGQAYRFHQN